MSDFQITEHKYDDSDDSLDKFKKVFATEVDEALVEKFKQAEGVYIVQGRFGPRSIIDLHKGVEQGFWTKDKLWTKDKRWLPEQPYNGNYLIIIRPSPSSNPADCLVARPSASQGIYFVENGSITSPKGVRFMEADTYRGFMKHMTLAQYKETPPGWQPTKVRRGGKGSVLFNTPRCKDLFYCLGNNTYHFPVHWGKDTINYYNSGHKLIFYSTSPKNFKVTKPENFKITKQEGDLKINKNGDMLTIANFYPENFSFYSAPGIGGKEQKYNLIESGEGQYKLALATK